VMMMSIGLLLPYGKWIERLILKLPEAKSSRYYFFLIILFFALGILPYLLFTEERFPDVFIESFTQMRAIGSEGVHWTVDRTGNLNYSWGGYVVQWVEAGYLGGLFAAFYAVLVGRNIWAKTIAWLIWGFWMAMAFGSGTRGQVVFMGLPVIALVYMRSQQVAGVQGKKLSVRAFWRSGWLLLLVLALVQFQATFREIPNEERVMTDVELFNLAGNNMFSEGMLAYYLIPETRPFFYDRFPGEALIRPLPDFVFLLVTHPIPRALWTSKPVDPLTQWYNVMATGRGNGLEGTTVAHGLVGSWYFKYGVAGIIEGGLLMGLLFSISERTLNRGTGRPMVIMMSLGLLTWLFRCFRDVTFPELWGLLLGFLVLVGLIWIGRAFSSAKT
jgi:oligosaccharide repeat unit polymerase